MDLVTFTKEILYGKLHFLRSELSVHCVRHPEEIASTLILCQPSKGRRNKGGIRTTYVDNFMKDTFHRKSGRTTITDTR